MNQLDDHCEWLGALMGELGFDLEDQNMVDTPKRIIKMFKETTYGLRHAMPEMTTFPNDGMDEVYTVGPVPVRTICAHHFLPVFGEAWIGVLPGAKLLGLSKFARITDWVFARPSTQEHLTVMLADTLSDLINPVGLGVVVRAQHTCMSWRGVKAQHSLMTTSVMRDEFLENPALKQEFFGLIKGQGY